MVKESTFLRMETFMKASSLKTIYKAKGNLQIQMEINILVHGKIIKEMVKESMYI